MKKSEGHVCPLWVGRFMVSPLRKLWQPPKKLLRPFVQKGMRVLEAGCGMGFFSLPLARLVGKEGKVICVDIQEKMIMGLIERAELANLDDRIIARLATSDHLGIGDLANSVDFVLLMAVVHESVDQEEFFRQIYSAMKPGAKILFIEPINHVSHEEFHNSLRIARRCGLTQLSETEKTAGLRAVLIK